MERGASPVLEARGAVENGRAVGGTRARMHTALASFGDACALACAALLGCVALVALGTVCSLLWMLVAEH